MVKVIPIEEIQRVVDYAGCLDAVEDALEALADGAVSAPEEIALTLQPSGDVHVKGAYIAGSRWIAFKVASGSFTGAANAGCSLLLDAVTGQPKVVLDDGGWLTEMRTAAAGAIATDLMARPGPLRVAMLGTGVQSRFQVEALRHRRQVVSLNVWGRRRERAALVTQDLGGQPFEDVGSAVADADVIITATSATDPILLKSHVPDGVHITAMGADTVGKNELDPAILRAAQVIVADDVHTCGRVGELQHTPGQHHRTLSLAQLVKNARVGQPLNRTSVADITVADLCGIGTYDAAVAALTSDRLGIK